MARSSAVWSEAPLPWPVTPVIGQCEKAWTSAGPPGRGRPTRLKTPEETIVSLQFSLVKSATLRLVERSRRIAAAGQGGRGIEHPGVMQKGK